MFLNYQKPADLRKSLRLGDGGDDWDARKCSKKGQPPIMGRIRSRRGPEEDRAEEGRAKEYGSEGGWLFRWASVNGGDIAETRTEHGGEKKQR